ncbi:hypothetical protein ZIOFF_059965 [Zingiber officinale]|uniref:Uncharacterized protein n=1 Tax=Zingiber officinale TaxID=94328 RepID=A0A8J5FDZ4_ZINOF|nr:hypothetical protein ZIOFF_059965 [Zingiber officinale]
MLSCKIVGSGVSCFWPFTFVKHNRCLMKCLSFLITSVCVGNFIGDHLLLRVAAGTVGIRRKRM